MENNLKKFISPNIDIINLDNVIVLETSRLFGELPRGDWRINGDDLIDE